MALVSDEIISSPHRPSYERFVTQDMRELLRRSVPVMGDDAPAKFRLAYGGMDLRSPTTTASECLRLSETYACTIFLRLHIIETHVPQGGDFTTNPPWTICLGQLPQLTTRDTFIVRGLERVPVAQLRPAAGVFLSVHEHPRSFQQTWQATFRPRRGAHMRLLVEQLARDADRYRFRMDSSLTPRRNLAGCLRAMGLWDDAAKKLAQEPLWGQVDVDGPDGLPSDQAAALREHLFGSHGAYDLSTEGREQLNRRLGPLADALECTLGSGERLTPGDIVAALGYLLRMVRDEDGYPPDDVNDLSNRRLWCVGDHLEEVLFDALAEARRMDEPHPHSLRAIMEEEVAWAQDAAGLAAAIGTRAANLFEGALKRYFLSSLCPPLDQTNPLAEVSHKRSVTFLGMGGIQSRRGNLERRGVHPTHAGRLCLVETPESDAIGLHLHLAAFARPNAQGQLEAPYRDAANGEVRWLTPLLEREACIASHQAEPDAEGKVLARHQGDVRRVLPSEVTHRDLQPGQSLGLAAALIPFVAHDELNRATMGAKNMKQAVPLQSLEPPLIKTGMEACIARLPTSSHTCFVQRPSVRVGQRVKRGQVIADGAAITQGELALGVNLLVAYLPWRGYNFEDGIVISDRLVTEDILTSVHFWEPSVEVRGDEKVGPGPEALAESLHQLAGPGDRGEGIIRVGAVVKPHDLLVRRWKVRYGIEQGDPIDQRLADEISGTVIAVERQQKAGVPHEDARLLKEIIRIRIKGERRVRVGDKLMGRHGNKGVVTKIVPAAEMPHLDDGTPVDVLLNPHGVVSRMNLGQLLETHWGWVARWLGCTFVAAPFERVRLAECRHARTRAKVEALLRSSESDEQALERLLKLASRRASVQMQGERREKVWLSDGRTGKRFEAPIVVGYQYILKLNHLVEDKLHAREQGQYNLLTDQPVKGRRRGGGQRLGEMEVWALEAHDVPHLLQECLTLRSDDVARRSRATQVQEVETVETSLPESFRTLAVLLRGLGLKLELRRGRLESSDVIDTWEYQERLPVAEIQAVRLSIASPEDISRWSGRQGIEQRVGHAQAVQKRQSYEYLCPRHGIVQRADKYIRRVRCPQCGGRVERRVQVERAYTPQGLFAEEVFGDPGGAAWREQMACIELAAPVINPLFGAPLSRLLGPGGGADPWVQWREVKDVDSGARLRWQDYAREPLRPVVGGAEYLEGKLQEILGETWQPGDSGWRSDPRFVILRRLPVIPPDFRRLWQWVGEDDRPSDLHQLYSRVLLSNNMLTAQLQAEPPNPFQVTLAKRRLQKAVNALLVDGHDDRHSGRRLHSLAELMKGKAGLLRHALLGKRVDYSGRSVIVADPELALDEFRLPMAMLTRMAATMLRTDDCRTSKGIPLRRFVPLMKGEELPVLETRLIGRVPLADVCKDDTRLARAAEPITPEQAQAIGKAGIGQVMVRSPCTCEAEVGICRTCYGWDLSTRDYPTPWLPVGIIAGQSIGERGTQLTMRTFHTGGVSGEDITSGLPRIQRLVEGWVDMRMLDELDADGRPIPGTAADEWDRVRALEARVPQGEPQREPSPKLAWQLTDRGQVKSEARRLRELEQDLGIGELCHRFLWEMHRVYKGEVDDRHGEVILRAMRSPEGGHLMGVSQAVRQREGFLARAAFERAIDVLVEAAVAQQEDRLQGFKERLMLGRLIHPIEGDMHAAVTGEGQEANHASRAG